MRYFKWMSVILVFSMAQHASAGTSSGHETTLKKLVAALKTNKADNLLSMSMNHENTMRFLNKVKQHCGVNTYNANKTLLVTESTAQKFDEKNREQIHYYFKSLRKSFPDKFWHNAQLSSSKIIRKTNECGTHYYSVSMKIQAGDKKVSVVATLLNLDSDWILQLFAHDVLSRY